MCSLVGLIRCIIVIRGNVSVGLGMGSIRGSVCHVRLISSSLMGIVLLAHCMQPTTLRLTDANAPQAHR